MDKKIINSLCWWIPIRKLRDQIRNILYEIIDTREIALNNREIINILTKDMKNISVIKHCSTIKENFKFYDLISSETVKAVTYELDQCYNLDIIDFKKGDCVIDIGANIGMVSIYLAKLYPFLKIYSFEPSKQNYDNFLNNIKLNGIEDNIIVPHNFAVTKDGRDVSILLRADNSGGSNIYNKDKKVDDCLEENIKSVRLDDIFEKYNIKNCKLLKIDCEGSEYEILYNTKEENLRKCENMRGEFHGDMEKRKELYDYCKKYINKIEVEFCE